MQKSGGGGGGAAPTGCFKCGRPGHWSRDCPSSSSSSSAAADNPKPNPSSFPSKFSQGAKKPFTAKDNATDTTAVAAATTTTKKAPRTRPKLTPELLLSDDGLGYVLRHFPRSFKYHGRGREVEDLGSLIGLYTEWHSRLIPYYSYNQFVHKVEQIGATKPLRRCIGELRERIANGGDPTKLHEPPTENVAPDGELEEAMETEIPVSDILDPPLEDHDADDIREEMIDEIFQKAIEEPSQSLQQGPSQSSQSVAAPEVNPESRSASNQVANNSATDTSKIQITEEQRARMEANRLKALERAAARARSSLLAA